MRTFKILLIDDDKEQGDQLQESLQEINEDEDLKFTVEGYIAINVEEAAFLLYTQKFDGIIVDLKLNEGDEIGTDETLSGNLFLNEILRKEFIPVIVRTGTPDRFVNEFEDNNHIIKVYAKNDKGFYEHINELLEMGNSSLFKIFGDQGEMNNAINKLFWSVIPNCFSSWGEEEVTKIYDKEKTLIRYISSWLINEYNFSEESYNMQDPLEMYMFPNSINQICTGDIFQKENEHYIVLTPACDLANKKTENCLLAKIVPHAEVEKFFSDLNKIKDINDEVKFQKKLKSLSKWFRNGELPRFHFLPQVSFFEGGFVDFQQVNSVYYNAEEHSLVDIEYKKIGVLTDPFVKDVVSRFGSYYHRQGQPEFDGNRVIEYFN